MAIHESFYRKRFQAVAGFYKGLESAQQVEFVEKCIPLAPQDTILDLACGYGRHAILLAKKGYSITGYDLSVDYLDQAKQEAEKAGAKVVLERVDMRCLNVFEEFDVVLSLSTSLAFYDDEVNRDILGRVFKALRPGGTFLFDQANIFWLAATFANKSGTERLPDGGTHHYTYSFDAEKCVMSRRSILEDEDGREESGWDIRYYTLPELTLIVKEIGFEIVQAYGDYDGSQYCVDSKRLITILKKLR